VRNEAPPPMNVLDLQWRDVPNGYELETVVEFARSDGTTALVRQFWQHLDFGESYVTVCHAARGSAPAQTFVVAGQKGEVEGDFRTDRTEMLVMLADGSVKRTEQTVKTWLKGDAMREKVAAWYRDGREAGLTPQQILSLIWSMESPASGQGPEGTP
jgi:hypothetical protein